MNTTMIDFLSFLFKKIKKRNINPIIPFSPKNWPLMSNNSRTLHLKYPLK